MKTANTFKVHLGILIFLIPLLSAKPTDAKGSLPPVPQNPPAQAPADNPPARVARISYLAGSVSFLRAGVDQWSQAALNFPVTTGDRIYTAKGARAELEAGPYTVRLSDATDLTITNLNDQIMQLGLEQGTFRVSVNQLPAGDTIEVDTPNGALTLLEQGTYRVDTDSNGGSTLVNVNSGSLEITGGGVSQKLQAGQAVKLTGQDPIHVESVRMPRLDSFDNWSEERDQRLLSAASANYVSRNTPGYADLDAYGRWQEIPEYGPIWYPAGVAVDWVPYRFGHWAWVYPWGWTWVEDEPWGFCPFHYGRWVHIGAAWGWVPGPYVVAPVYAPAFVAFVGGPSFSVSFRAGGVGIAAWFPLGPGEPYFPWYHCRDDYLREVNFTNIRNVTNITNITNVTNINNIRYAYRTVATTAVRQDVFSSGQPVAHQMVRLAPQELSRAQIIPHPAVNPTASAALPGNPVETPPVRAASLVAANRTASGSERSASVEKRQPSPPSVRDTPIAANSRPTPPAGPNARAQLPTRGAADGPPSTSPPRLITRATPPPLGLPFTQSHLAMADHPGRPLEPQQFENLRAGRLAGPMLDREFPPHAKPLQRVRAAPPARRARPTRP